MSQTISSSGHIRNGAVQTELMARDDTTITDFPKCADMRRPSCWTIFAGHCMTHLGLNNALSNKLWQKEVSADWLSSRLQSCLLDCLPCANTWSQCEIFLSSVILLPTFFSVQLHPSDAPHQGEPSDHRDERRPERKGDESSTSLR